MSMEVRIYVAYLLLLLHLCGQISFRSSRIIYTVQVQLQIPGTSTITCSCTAYCTVHDPLGFLYQVPVVPVRKVSVLQRPRTDGPVLCMGGKSSHINSRDVSVTCRKNFEDIKKENSTYKWLGYRPERAVGKRERPNTPGQFQGHERILQKTLKRKKDAHHYSLIVGYLPEAANVPKYVNLLEWSTISP